MDSFKTFEKLLKSLSDIENLTEKLADEVVSGECKDKKNQLVVIARRINDLRDRGPFRLAQRIEKTEPGYSVELL